MFVSCADTNRTIAPASTIAPTDVVGEVAAIVDMNLIGTAADHVGRITTVGIDEIRTPDPTLVPRMKTVEVVVVVVLPVATLMPLVECMCHLGLVLRTMIATVEVTGTMAIDMVEVIDMVVEAGTVAATDTEAIGTTAIEEEEEAPHTIDADGSWVACCFVCFLTCRPTAVEVGAILSLICVYGSRCCV